MKTHELKCWPLFFAAIEKGHKTFEVRKNDRGFQKGDRLLLAEWLVGTGEFTGREMLFDVTYVLKGGKFGIEAGYVAMAIKRVEEE